MNRRGGAELMFTKASGPEWRGELALAVNVLILMDNANIIDSPQKLLHLLRNELERNGRRGYQCRRDMKKWSKFVQGTMNQADP